MALGGTIRGKTTTLRLPVEADLASYNDWMADMRVRHAHWVWHEPAMPATWKERFTEAAKDKQLLLWSIESARGQNARCSNGSYVDEVKLSVEKEAWQERWRSEREYPPVPPEAVR